MPVEEMAGTSSEAMSRARKNGWSSSSAIAGVGLDNPTNAPRTTVIASVRSRERLISGPPLVLTAQEAATLPAGALGSKGEPGHSLWSSVAAEFWVVVPETRRGKLQPGTNVTAAL